jgi:hypothetical protein
MSFSPVVSSTRREFFRAAGRYGLLSALGLIAAVVGVRRGRSGQRCVNRGLCNGCAVFVSCGLPQALSAKDRKTGGQNEAVRDNS